MRRLHPFCRRRLSSTFEIVLTVPAEHSMERPVEHDAMTKFSSAKQRNRSEKAPPRSFVRSSLDAFLLQEQMAADMQSTLPSFSAFIRR